MYIAYLIVTIITIAVNTIIVIADFAKARFVVDNAAAVGVSESSVPVHGVLKGAGVIGLLLGLAGVPLIGIAAAAGLTMFFIGAIIVHIRASAFSTMVFPGIFLALAAGSLALAVLE